MIQVNLNYKILQGFPWFAQIIRKLEYHLGRGPVIFIACWGGAAAEDFKGNDMGKRGRDQLSPTAFKEENFWKFNCLWMVGVGGRGKKNRTALWSDKKKFHRDTNKMLRFHPPPLPIISCMTFSSQYYATKLIINDVYVVEPRFHEVPRDLCQGFVTSQSAHKLLLCT